MITFDWEAMQYARHERMTAIGFRALQKKGIDPFRVALEAAHDAGLEFHASYRPAGFLYPPPRDERNAGGVFARHPEWHGRDLRGPPDACISYAFPEARLWVVSLLREMAEYPIDGVTILYNRRPPLVEYEAPVVESFQAKPRPGPAAPARGRTALAPAPGRHLTAFMTEVRAAMDEIGGRTGRPRQVSAVIMGTEARNLEFGMDVRAWARAGIVDWLIPYESGDDLLSTRTSFDNAADAAWLVDITRGTRCQPAVNLMPREIMPADYWRRAEALYRSGVEHLYFWDSYERCDFSDSWTALRQLGHRDRLQAWLRAGRPRLAGPQQPLLRLGNWDMGYGTPG